MNNFTQNQTLYKVSASTKKVQVWYGWTENSSVFCGYGELDGKLQTNTHEATPKNIGRSNETSASEQALIELEAMYQSQVDNKHYKLSIEEAKSAAEVCRIPRKISDYKHRHTKMSDTLLSSIKLDGSRGCVIEGTFYSKIGREEDVKVSHLKAVLEELGELATFDSEIYGEGLSLQRIRSAWLKPYKTDKEVIKVAKDAAKRKGDDVKIANVEEAITYLGYNPNDDVYKLKFHVFDFPDDTGLTFVERVSKMRDFQQMIIAKKLDVYFEFVYPVETNGHEHRMNMLEDVTSQGYEGLVHYEPEGVYEFGKRSTNTCKSKKRFDSEALVTGVELCKNGEGKLLLKACDKLGNVTFKAMMKGTHESRMYDIQKELIGKWITFEYEDLSDSCVPTKGVGIRVRDCDDKGNPLN